MQSPNQQNLLHSPSNSPPPSIMDISLNSFQPAALGLASYILTNFYPNALAQLNLHPRLTRLFSFFLALWALGPYAWSKLHDLWQYTSFYVTSSISISNSDDLHPHLLQWLSRRNAIYIKKNFRVSSLLKQQSIIKNISHTKNDDEDEDMDPLDRPRIGSWRSSDGIQYNPLSVLPFFFYKWRLFFADYNSISHDTTITLTCLGRSTQIMHDVLAESIRMYKESQTRVTIVKRPSFNRYDHRGRNCWEKASEKSQRTMESVNLDPEQKQLLLADMDDYVAGKTASWYKAHCVPYRRGYLFWGPPGCGKSSMALALAGRYHCDIHMISLRDSNMCDDTLMKLLKTLPPRALVLLEDIDSAGLKRENGGTYDYNDFDDYDDYDRYRNNERVTLSGLLNAIDGVDAPEGHILIMTSNTPEDLDEALVRSGRVSVKIGFKKASPELGKEMFLRMYHDVDIVNPDLTLTPDELENLASAFADALPDDELSLADLQDFMLERKSEPHRAVEELTPYLEKVRVEKELELAKKQEKAAKRMKAREKAKALRLKEEEEEAAEDGSSEATAVEEGVEEPTKEGKEMAVTRWGWRAALGRVLFV